METFKVLVIDQDVNRLQWICRTLRNVSGLDVRVEAKEAIWEGNPNLSSLKRGFWPNAVICRPQIGSICEDLKLHGCFAGGTAGLSNYMLKYCEFPPRPLAWLAAPEDLRQPRFGALRSWASNLNFDILGDESTCSLEETALVRLSLLRVLQMHVQKQQNSAKIRPHGLPSSAILLSTPLWQYWKPWLYQLAQRDPKLMRCDPVAATLDRLIIDGDALFEGILSESG